MKKVILSSLIAISGFAMTAAYAGGNADAGKTKSQACVGCHGMNGKSNNPNYPNLAGQKELYLVKAITAYKTGDRKDPMMAPMIGSLSDADIADLAAYYSSVK